MLSRQTKSYAVDILVHLSKAVKPCGQCPALNANGLITSVSLTVLRFNEMGLRSIGMRHYKLISYPIQRLLYVFSSVFEPVSNPNHTGLTVFCPSACHWNWWAFLLVYMCFARFDVCMRVCVLLLRYCCILDVGAVVNCSCYFACIDNLLGVVAAAGCYVQIGMGKRQPETMTKGVRACDGERHSDNEAWGWQA